MGHNFLVRFFGFVVQLRQQQRSDCHWHKTSSLQSGKQEAIYARKGERLVSTGISEIGSHP